jgi:hypothetical protein
MHSRKPSNNLTNPSSSTEPTPEELELQYNKKLREFIDIREKFLHAKQVNPERFPSPPHNLRSPPRPVDTVLPPRKYLSPTNDDYSTAKFKDTAHNSVQSSVQSS